MATVALAHVPALTLAESADAAQRDAALDVAQLRAIRESLRFWREAPPLAGGLQARRTAAAPALARLQSTVDREHRYGRAAAGVQHLGADLAGPVYEFMGTLIPLGPALVGLAAGYISLLARKMEVAFATTVVGLVIGAIVFLLHQAAQRWAMDDLSLLDFLSAKLREPS